MLYVELDSPLKIAFYYPLSNFGTVCAIEL